MGKLFEMRQKIEKAIEDKNLPALKVKGTIGLKTGLDVSVITPETPDDEAKIAKLRQAVKEVLDLVV
jgi:hypothetical protein